MDPSTNPTDSCGDRPLIPTEKGEQYFENQRNTHLRKVKSTSQILIDCIINSAPLPKSPTALENLETSLEGAFNRYDRSANDYLDFLSRSSKPEASKELEEYWPVMNDIKRQLNEVIEKIHVKKESSEVKSHSSSSLASSASLVTSKKRAKAEFEKIKLQFLKKEAEIKKEHFQKSIELELLQQEKMVAAADAEASYLEKQLIDDGENREHMALPKEEITPFNKTMNYLEGLVSPSKPEPHALSTQATAFVPAAHSANADVETAASEFQRQITFSEPSPQVHPKPTTQLDTHVVSTPRSFNPMHDTSSFLIKKNILLESLQQQQFEDRPDRYIVWKRQFKSMVTDINCSPLEEISLLTNCIRKESDAYKLVMSARTSCASNPVQCLHTIWSRMDERFGSAELLQSSLKTRLSDLPDLTDRKQLYALHDLLTEIEAVKNLQEYSVTISYLDSSLGIKPVIQKLPRHIQEKWVNRVVSYKKGNPVLFPPFAEFVRFIGEMSVIRSDPGLIYEMSKPTSHTKRNVNRNRTVSVTTRKTNTSFENPKDTTQGCLLHRGAKHTINECKAFLTRS